MINDRLKEGERVYGNKSVSRPTGFIVNDIAEELADICGWAAVLYARLMALKQVMDKELKETDRADDQPAT